MKCPCRRRKAGSEAVDNMTEGEVVWAKVAGYPWWPAVITAVTTESVTVAFLGENA